MEILSNLVRVHIPSLFQGVPIPDSFSGFAHLSAGDWLKLIAFSGGVYAVGYGVRRAYLAETRPGRCNQAIELDSNKVVNAVDIEDLGDKQAYCRCWKSKKFPMCDGSHNKHNEETGDNVGPLLVKKKSA